MFSSCWIFGSSLRCRFTNPRSGRFRVPWPRIDAISNNSVICCRINAYSPAWYVRCVWASMSPGITVRPPTSRTRASPGVSVVVLGPTAEMALPSTRVARRRAGAVDEPRVHEDERRGHASGGRRRCHSVTAS
jgi:hypothetical protein